MLWKAVEKALSPWRACSACAGDYEDPDWSAWEQEPEDSQDVIDPDDNPQPPEEQQLSRSPRPVVENTFFLATPRVPQEAHLHHANRKETS